MRKFLLIAVGGAAGAIVRYVVGSAVAQRFGTRFSLGTLSINISACVLIGCVLEYLNRHAGVSVAWRYLIPVGFIGAYSTFSTFEYEAWTDIARGDYWVGAFYVAVSLVGGFVGIGLGVAAARSLP